MLHLQAVQRARPRRAEVELARLRFRERHEFGDAVGRHARIGDKDAGHVRDLGDRREVLLRVDRQVRKDRGIDRDRADVAEIDRVTVGGRLGGELHADIARRAGAVVDDDLLAEEFGELRRNDPRHEIRGAARSEGNDHPHRPIRIACLPECKSGAQRQRKHQPRAQLFHDSSLQDSLVSTLPPSGAASRRARRAGARSRA